MRRELKEAISQWVQKLMEGTDYAGVEVSSTNSNTKAYPRIVIDRTKPTPVTNEYSGVLSINPLTGRKKILYLTDFTVTINSIAEIDEEAYTIAEIIVDNIRKKTVELVSDKINIIKVYDQISINEPEKLKTGKLEAYSSTIVLDIRVKEIKE